MRLSQLSLVCAASFVSTTHALGSFKLPTKGGKPKVAKAEVEKKAVATKGKPAAKVKAAKPAFSVKGKAAKPAPKAKAAKPTPKAKAAKPAPKAKAAKPAPKPKAAPIRSSVTKTIVVEDLPGVLPPVGFFDPLGFAARADDNTIRKYREAELTHGRIAMVASLGFFVGELAAGRFPLFEGVDSSAGILQIKQVPATFWISFAAGTFAIETLRVQRAIVDPTISSKEEIGKYRTDYIPGDLGFDPLGLKPNNPEEFKSKQTKELQNGRLAMLAVSGFLAQELTDKKGLVEHLLGYIPQDILDSLPSIDSLLPSF